jgi:hypothetical protein
MNNITDQNNHRDFIDFLLLLYRHSRFFFIILIVSSTIALLINFNQTELYKFNVRIKVTASNDVFMPAIMYRDNLRMSADEAAVGLGQEFSSQGVDQVVNDLLLGGRLFPLISAKLQEVSLTDLNLRSSIDAKRDDQYFNIDVKSSDRFIVSSIHENIVPEMQKEIKRIYKGIINSHKDVTIAKIESLIKYDTANRLREVSSEIIKSQFQENQSTKISDELISRAVYSSYNEKLQYIKNLEIPTLELPYIYFVQSPISNTKATPSLFLYIFSLFISVFLFIFFVIIIDLKNQVFLRREIQNKK